MKRKHAELSNTDTTPAKNAKVTKELSELLKEVSVGDYEDFRAWLAQTNCKSLNLVGTAYGINFSHLGNALQNTAVTKVKLSDNGIDAKGAKDFGQALKDTCVTHVNLDFNKIGAKGAKDFGQALKRTCVAQVSLRGNSIGDIGAKDFGESLKGTLVTHVNLRANIIGDEGAKELITSLAGSKVQNLDLFNNNITEDAVSEIAKLIDKTNLLALDLGFTHPVIKEALQWNQVKESYFEFARIHLLDAEKQQTLIGDKFPALTENSTTQDEIKFVACALANVPTEVACHIFSFLPLMNTQRVDNVFAEARKRPAVIIQSNKSADDKSLPRPIPRVC